MANILEVIISTKDQASQGLQSIGKNLDQVSKSFSTIGKTAVVTGAAITGAMAVSLKTVLDYGNQLDKMSKMSGIAVDSLSRLGYAAIQEHGSIESINTAMKILGSRMIDASDGLMEARRAFDRLGISVTDSQGRFRTLDSVFLEAVDRFDSLGSEAEKTSVAMDLFGRSGTELIPMIKMGRQEIEALGREAEALGIVLTTKEAGALKLIDDLMVTVQKGTLGLVNTIALSLIPEILTLAVGAKELIKMFLDWVRVNADLVKNVMKIIAVVGISLTVFGGLALALAGIVTGVSFVISTLGPLISTLVLLTAKVLMVGTVVGGLGKAFYDMRDDIKVITDWIVDKLIGAFNILMQKFPALGKLAKSFGQDVRTIFDFLKDEIPKVLEGSEVGKWFQGMKDNLIALKEQAAMFGDDIKLQVDALIERLNEAKDEAAEISRNVFQEFTDGWTAAAEQTKGIFFEIGGAFRKMYDGMYQGFGKAMASMIVQGKSFSETMKNIWDTLTEALLATIISMVAKMIAEELLLGLKVLAIESGKGMAKAISAHAGFPIVGIGMGLAAAAAIAASIGAIKFAKGGIVTQPTLGLVGEAGPEAIIPLSGPNAPEFMTGGGTFNVTVNVSAERSAGTLAEIAEAARAGTTDAIEAALLMNRLATANSSLAV